MYISDGVDSIVFQKNLLFVTPVRFIHKNTVGA